MHNTPTTVDDAGCHPGVIAGYTRGCNGSRAAVTRSKAGSPGLASTARATAIVDTQPHSTRHQPRYRADRYCISPLMDPGAKKWTNAKEKKGLHTSYM